MEQVSNCIICGSGDYALLSEKGRFGLRVCNVICKECGLVYQNPRPGAETLKSDYISSNYQARYKGVEFPNAERARTEYYYCRSYVDFIGRYYDLSSGGTVLDIGCSTGGVLRRMSEFGWKTLGIEPSHNYAEFTRSVYGLEVIEGLLEDTQLSPATFDIIFATQLLEHLPNPLDCLKQLRTSLKDDGLLMLSTPNILRPSGWYHELFHDVHLYMFSPNTLGSLLSIAGFDIMDYECRDGHVDLVAKKKIHYANLNYHLPADN